MGTPNSRTLLKDFVISGTTPTVRELCQLGLDVSILAGRHEAVAPQLKYLEGYELLEEACGHMHYETSWSQIVERAGLTGTRCFRFTRATIKDCRGSDLAIFSLMPWASGRIRMIEIFLLPRDGNWLAWYENAEGKQMYVRHDDVHTFVRNLIRIAGTGHYFSANCLHCAGLSIWSPRIDGVHRGDNVSAVALVLTAHLEQIVQKSVELKTARLATQQGLLEALRSVDLRNGLPSTHTATTRT